MESIVKKSAERCLSEIEKRRFYSHILYTGSINSKTYIIIFYESAATRRPYITRTTHRHHRRAVFVNDKVVPV